MKKSDTESKLKIIVKALDDKKGINIVVFNVGVESGYTDYMVYVTGSSSQHNKTLGDYLFRELKSEGFLKPHAEGSDSGKWILVDAGDVIVHIMLDDLRAYYDLEGIWHESKMVSTDGLIEK